jgi:predicted dehydrogenase
MERVKIGVVGVGRGRSYMDSMYAKIGFDLVAVCDIKENELHAFEKESKVATFTDFDRFLEHDMDAVVLANYFHEHAPFAIKAMNAGKHVLSETSSNSTLAEGVDLCRAVEKTGKIYMLAENYPYVALCQEMKHLYEQGEIGEVSYAEGEYNHPLDDESIIRLAPGVNHWRNWLPGAYYSTHALAPLMMITGTMPKRVSAFSVANYNSAKDRIQRTDTGYIYLCKMDNEAVFKIFGCGVPGHSIFYRIHGTRGAMESTRGPGYFGPGQVRVWHDEWDLKSDETREKTYYPEWRANKQLAQQASHGGGDFWVCLDFVNAVKSGKQPFLDVYRGVSMSTAGILAWRSALNDGAPYAIPDFTSETDRKLCEQDDWTPIPTASSLHKIPPSVKGVRQPSEEVMKNAQAVWQSEGY